MRAFVTDRVRPIRFALLADAEPRAILAALELNSYLWGGTLNPIVPISAPVTELWRTNIFGSERSTGDFLAECMETFDPDAVVKMSGLSVAPDLSRYEEQQRFVVGSADVGKTTWAMNETKFGTTVLDVAELFTQSEMRFERRVPIKFVQPILDEKWRLFQAALFGALDSERYGLYKSLLDAMGLELATPETSIAGSISYLAREFCFLRRLTQFGVVRQIKAPDLYLVDAEDYEQILDFLFQRAAGNPVVPIPLQALGEPGFGDTIKVLVRDDNVTVYLPERIPDSDVSRRVEQLGLPSARYLRHHSSHSIIRQMNRRTKVGDYRRFSSPVDPDGVTISLLTPFDGRLGGHLGNYNWANDISLWGSDRGNRLPTDVIPSGVRTIWSPSNMFLMSHGRISDDGVTLFSGWKDEETVPLPDAQTIIREFYATSGWDARPSDEGLRASQAFAVIGGLSHAHFLISTEAFDLLLNKEGFGSDGVMMAKALWRRLFQLRDRAESADSAKRKIRNLIRSMLSMQIMELGVAVQCETCRRSPWYPLRDLDKRVNCGYCTAQINLEQTLSEEGSMAYRLRSPFDDRKTRSNLLGLFAAAGFFDRVRGGEKTIGLGTIVTKGTDSSEVDLTILTKGWHGSSPPIEPIFVEAKGANDFDQADIDSFMRLLPSFPSATYVFSTLREEISDAEKRLLTEFVRSTVRGGRPWHNVIVLTHGDMAWELRSQPDAYRDALQFRDLSSAAIATQSKYLGLRPDASV